MRRIHKIAFTGLVIALALPSGAALAQAARPSSFAMCGACHSVKAGENRLGPTLAGVAGRKPGAVAGFKYSAAMKAKGGKWTDAELDSFLANPRAALPGTTMAFAGQKDAAKRAELVAYLKTLK
jgi:cytochrome c